MKQNLLKLDKLPQAFDVCGLLARRATTPDVPEIVNIINVGFSYQDRVRGRLRITEPEQRELVKTEAVYCIEDTGTGEIVGTVSANLSSDRRNTLHLTRLAISEPYQGKGIARELMAKMEYIASAQGYEAIDIGYMHVAPKWLADFYTHIGYVPIENSTYTWQGVEISEMIKRL